jgi:hypothetical protein
MSTIKSSAENLTLNADGSGNDIKFQSNGSEVASIDQAGLLTAGGGVSATGAVNSTGEMRVSNPSATSQLYLYGASGQKSNIILNEYGVRAWHIGAGTETSGQLSIGDGTTERMRFQHGGVVSIPSGIELGSGVDNTAANTLDDYEEGTWTPTIIAHTGTSPTVGGTNSGKYTKIGNMVTVAINFDSITISGVTSGIFKVSNLPYLISGDWVGSLNVNNFNFVRNDANSLQVIGNDGFGVLSSDGGGWGWELISVISSGAAAFRGTITYRAA